jgi:hypothetical protein
LIKSLFGAEDNLKQLTDTSKDSLQQDLSDLRLGAVLMVAAFAKRDSQGQVHCGQSLHLTLGRLGGAPGKEEIVGDCDAQVESRFKSLMGLAARMYKSPVFQGLSDSVTVPDPQ